MITWLHVAQIHYQVQQGLYRSEREIFEREADMLNKIIDAGKMARRAARKNAAKTPRPQVVPDKRRKLRDRAERKDRSNGDRLG